MRIIPTPPPPPTRQNVVIEFTPEEAFSIRFALFRLDGSHPTLADLYRTLKEAQR